MTHVSQLWHWKLNGLNGIVDMMDGMKQAGMNADQRKRLKDVIARQQVLLTYLEQNAPEKADGQRQG